MQLCACMLFWFNPSDELMKKYLPFRKIKKRCFDFWGEVTSGGDGCFAASKPAEIHIWSPVGCRGPSRSAAPVSQVDYLDKFILQFKEIHFSIWTNTFFNLDKYNLDKYINKITQRNLDKFINEIGQIWFWQMYQPNWPNEYGNLDKTFSVRTRKSDPPLSFKAQSIPHLVRLTE